MQSSSELLGRLSVPSAPGWKTKDLISSFVPGEAPSQRPSGALKDEQEYFQCSEGTVGRNHREEQSGGTVGRNSREESWGGTVARNRQEEQSQGTVARNSREQQSRGTVARNSREEPSGGTVRAELAHHHIFLMSACG